MRFGRCLLAWCIVAAISPATAPAQGPWDQATLADSVRRRLHAAVINGGLENVRSARAFGERALALFPDDPLLQHYVGYALYREATLLRGGEGDDHELGPVLDQAQRVLERSVDVRPLPETHALLSAVLGLRIGENPLQAIVLGPRSGAEMDHALALAPENPRVWLIRGSNALFTPELFGGGTERALDYLARALTLFVGDDPAPPAPAWGRAEAYAWLGMAHAREGRVDDARAAYLQALRIEPEYAWVRDVLLPGLDRR